ncbi:MAG: Mov34/MPN/PAD-1 family protein [Eubacteriales bacterium]|nr:Mov34/MPN/PAD-1 family protein [Eubacteriales bacterium]
MLEDKMNIMFGDDAMDLGSNDFGGMFEDTDLDKLFGESTPEPEQTPKEEEKTPVEAAETSVAQQAEPVATQSAEAQVIAEQTAPSTEKVEEKNEEAVEQPAATENAAAVTNADADKLESDEDIYASELAAAEKKETESAKSGLIKKLPIFVYGKAKDEIVDTSITFEALRLEKAEDFPELDDGENVSWKVTYGSISKNVTTPKDTTIASFKKKIEESKEFPEAIKKAKGDLKCEITPSVKAKKKGVMSAYKGLYETVDAARMSDKVISYVPSENGRLYEIRSNGVGTFIVQTRKATAFQKVRAGFIPALPKIPFSVLSEILAFFKSYITKDRITEALAYIFWSKTEERYFVHIPKQEVSKASVDTTEMPLEDERFILVMEIHSHNTMPAYFSGDDDKDEKATGLYAVVGSFDKVFPDILVRISVGGKFVEIPLEDIFDGIDGTFPEKWKDAVTIKEIKEQEEMK